MQFCQNRVTKRRYRTVMKKHSLRQYQLPREKLGKLGARHLSLAELCAVILGTGTSRMPVIPLAKKVAELLITDPHSFTPKLSSILGSAQTLRMLAAVELGRRVHLRIHDPVLSPELALNHASELRTSKKELMIGLYMDSRSRVIHKEILAVGGLNQASLVPRDVLIPLRHHPESQSLLLLHNHPSGDPQPSQDDISFTTRIQEMCSILGLDLHDHLIVAEERWASLRELGHLR